MAEKRLVKLVENIIGNPKTVSFDEIQRLLEGFGYKCRQPRGGSHFTFRKAGANPITVPRNKPVKEIYVKNIIRLLELESWYEKNG